MTAVSLDDVISRMVGEGGGVTGAGHWVSLRMRLYAYTNLIDCDMEPQLFCACIEFIHEMDPTDPPRPLPLPLPPLVRFQSGPIQFESNLWIAGD